MKRRVIAIAVVLAAVGLCVPLWMNEGPLWRVLMLERVLDTSEPNLIELKWVWRWGENRGRTHGPVWVLHTLHRTVDCQEIDRVVRTLWGSDGQIAHQFAELAWRTSPPWWPHPPLIDLREFQE